MVFTYWIVFGYRYTFYTLNPKIMAQFLARIELHSGKWPEDYEKLHACLIEAGFSRNITSDKADTYVLPTAEYRMEAATTLQNVYSAGNLAASKVGKTYGILVVEYTSSMWDGLVPANK
jgi:hypothetical protein